MLVPVRKYRKPTKCPNRREKSMSDKDDMTWRSSSVVSKYLEELRESRPFLKEQIEVMLRLVSALGRPVNRFMDLGCGDGLLAEAIFEKHPQAIGILADYSTPMLDAARLRMEQFSGSVDFRNIDYGAPEWIEVVAESMPFDLIVSGFSIHHQPDDRKRRIYDEIFRMLQPGGMFINLEHVASPTPRLERLWDDVRNRFSSPRRRPTRTE